MKYDLFVCVIKSGNKVSKNRRTNKHLRIRIVIATEHTDTFAIVDVIQLGAFKSEIEG